MNPDGRLGTIGSSRRVKDDIRDMDDASAGLGKLRPVTFRYKAEHDDGARLVQYGLIAEEVAEIYPELVVLDKDGQPAGVRYHVLPAMLLNELQRQQRVIEAQTRLLDELTARSRGWKRRAPPLPDAEQNDDVEEPSTSAPRRELFSGRYLTMLRREKSCPSVTCARWARVETTRSALTPRLRPRSRIQTMTTAPLVAA